MDSMYIKYKNQTRATSSCCAEFANLRFGATPRTKQKESRKPGSRRGRPGDQEKRRHQEGGWQDTTIQQSFLI